MPATRMQASTGPKISSRCSAILGLTWSNRVRAQKIPFLAPFDRIVAAVQQQRGAVDHALVYASGDARARRAGDDRAHLDRLVHPVADLQVLGAAQQ